MLRLTHKRDILQRQLAPGCSEKSSASAETAHTPAVAGAPWALFATLFALPAAPTGAGRSRPRFYLRHCRVTRDQVTNCAHPRLGSGHCPPTLLRRARRALSLVCDIAASSAVLFFITPIRNFPRRLAASCIWSNRSCGRRRSRPHAPFRRRIQGSTSWRRDGWARDASGRPPQRRGWPRSCEGSGSPPPS